MTYYLMVAYHINESIGQSAKMQNAVNRCLATSSVKGVKSVNYHCIKKLYVKNRQGETENKTSEQSALV